MSYNKEIDYQEKIDEAVKRGDYENAALYEKSRNEKIDGENLNYKKTNHYSGWLDKTDYSDVLRSQMESGASKSAVAGTLQKRVNKAKGTIGLTKYAADDVYEEAIKYIMGSGNFSYKKDAPEYVGNYSSQLERLLEKLENVKKFSYNPYEDDLYEYYRKQYIREGNRAMEDLLGELAANTGGVISSYAAGAAAQSRNYYNEKLTDKIPELYQDAYERYLDEIGLLEDNVKILADLEENEYARYLDSLNQYNKDREFEYKKFTDERDYEKTDRESELEYEYLMKKLENEALENSNKWEQQKYENEQEKIETALRKWEKLGYLDEESAKILGLPAGTHTIDYDYKKAQQYKMYNK